MKSLPARALVTVAVLLLTAVGLIPAAVAEDGPKAAATPAPTADQKASDEAWALLKAGKLDEAAKAARALVAARTKALGAEDKETLRARHLLARVTLDLGQNAEAEKAQLTLIPLFSRVFGAEDRATLTCRRYLLYALAAQGRLQETADGYRSLIPTLEHALGPEDKATLTVHTRGS